MDSRWWGTYGSVFITGLSAFGYVVGVASIGRFASTLGVGVQDLGLGTQEYLTLAAIYGLGMAAVAGLSIGYLLLLLGYLFPLLTRNMTVEGSGKRSGLVLLLMLLTALLWILPFGLLVLVSDQLGVSEQTAWTSGPALLLIVAFGVLGREIAVSVDGGGKPDAPEKWWKMGRLVVVPPSVLARSAALGVLLLTFVATAAFALRSATLWAEELSAGQTPAGGFSLDLILQPTPGEFPDIDGCIIRVSPRVHLINGAPRIGDVDAFTSSDCSPDWTAARSE